MGLDIYFDKVKKEELGYFRKYNFLVKFFSDCGMDVINQKPYMIDKDEAIDLYGRCEAVLNDHDKAEELLPTMDGFFFGSTEYDDSYFNAVKKVKEFIHDRILPLYDDLKENETIEFSIWY